MPIRAILFDVGGPLDTEEADERLVDLHIQEELLREGIRVNEWLLTDANAFAVACFAPNTYRTMIWRLCGQDARIAQAVHRRFIERREERRAARGGFEPRPGMPELLAGLRSAGLRLGIVANQPPQAIEAMEKAGFRGLLDLAGVSGTSGLSKPDPRLFLRACEALSVEPREAVMVGDRIDNDIAPAKLLGMKAILFRTGRHIAQQPRDWDELPDETVHDTEELRQALARLCQRPALGATTQNHDTK